MRLVCLVRFLKARRKMTAGKEKPEKESRTSRSQNFKDRGEYSEESRGPEETWYHSDPNEGPPVKASV